MIIIVVVSPYSLIDQPTDTFFKLLFVTTTLMWWLFCRHWSRIPLNGRGRPSHFSHIQSPDGTYLASEFNYSLPRKREYDSVGYKHHTLDGNSQLDPRFMKNIKPDREHDKGYYSDRTYESPICDHGPTAGRGSMGYHTVNPTRSVTENIPSDNFGSHTNSNLTVMPRSGIPNLPVGDTHFKVNAHLVAWIPRSCNKFQIWLRIIWLYHEIYPVFH